MTKSNNLKTFLNGIVMENPVLVLLLGTCPTIAITTNVYNAIGMGIAFSFVLLFSNLIISLIRKLIPNEIRIPVYIVTIATFVTIAQMLLEAFLPSINDSLGRFVSLIVVNCIILGRVEAFASKNNPGKSLLDALGMSIGFICALIIIASIRELLGSGTLTIWDGVKISFLPIYEFLNIEPIYILSNSSIGGFLVYGLVIALVTAIKTAVVNKRAKKAEEALKTLKGGVSNV